MNICLKRIKKPNPHKNYFKDEIHYSPTQIAELASGGFDVSGLESGGDSGPSRALGQGSIYSFPNFPYDPVFRVYFFLYGIPGIPATE